MTFIEFVNSNPKWMSEHPRRLARIKLANGKTELICRDSLIPENESFTAHISNCEFLGLEEVK